VVRVALERLDELAARDLEDLDELVGPQLASLVASGLKQTPNTWSLWTWFLMSMTSLPLGISKTSLRHPRSGAAAGREQLAVLGEGKGADSVGEAGELLAEHAGLGVPEVDFLEAAAGQELAVWAECQRLDNRQVSGLDRLLVRRDQLGSMSVRTWVPEPASYTWNLVAAAGGHGRFIGLTATARTGWTELGGTLTITLGRCEHRWAAWRPGQSRA